MTILTRGVGLLATSDNAQSKVETRPVTKVVPFNRKHKRAPDYLERLRTRGWWRMWDYIYHDLGKDSVYYRSVAFREAQFAPKGVFVDAGCGWSADALIASYAGYKKCYKLDIYPLKGRNNIGENNLRKAETKRKVEFIQHDICEYWPIDDNSVDLISCNAMIDLISDNDRQLFYREAYRVLKPGGQLSICVVILKNGYGYDIVTERNVLTMPGWGIGFELERNYPSGFIMQKPKADTTVTDLQPSDLEANSRPSKAQK